MSRIPADHNDFPEGSEERHEAALSTAGTTAPVDTFIEDWGEYNEDHTGDEHAIAHEHTEIDEPYFDGAEILTFKDGESE